MSGPVGVIGEIGSCRVVRCTCGSIRLTIGPVTMVVTEGTLRALEDVMGQSLGAIELYRHQESQQEVREVDLQKLLEQSKDQEKKR